MRQIHPWQCIRMLLLLLSHFSRVRLCVTPEMAAHQAPPSLGFSRQEHWSGLSFPSPNLLLLMCLTSAKYKHSILIFQPWCVTISPIFHMKKLRLT